MTGQTLVERSSSASLLTYCVSCSRFVRPAGRCGHCGAILGAGILIGSSPIAPPPVPRDGQRCLGCGAEGLGKKKKNRSGLCGACGRMYRNHNWSRWLRNLPELTPKEWLRV